MADYSQWIKDLSKKTGASVEQSDIDRLNSTNADDVSRLQGALTSQYQRRGSSGQEGSGMEAAQASAAGYGSARGETSDDRYNPAPASNDTPPPGGTMNSWTGQPTGVGGSSSGAPDWYRQSMDQQLEFQRQSAERANQLQQQQFEYQKAQDAQRQARADSLYGTLLGRAQQGLDVDPNNPVIRAQTDVFNANQDRARRGYLSDTAERSGPYANLQGERRMTAEKVGQAGGEFQAQLMGRELQSKRDEIAQALSGMQGMLSADQAANLQRQLSLYDNAIKQTGMGNQMALGLGDLGLRSQLGLGDLNLRGMLGSGDLSLRASDQANRNYFANMFGQQY